MDRNNSFVFALWLLLAIISHHPQNTSIGHISGIYINMLPSFLLFHRLFIVKTIIFSLLKSSISVPCLKTGKRGFFSSQTLHICCSDYVEPEIPCPGPNSADVHKKDTILLAKHKSSQANSHFLRY